METEREGKNAAIAVIRWSARVLWVISMGFSCPSSSARVRRVIQWGHWQRSRLVCWGSMPSRCAWRSNGSARPCPLAWQPSSQPTLVFVSVLTFCAGCASTRSGRGAGRQLHPKEKDRGGAVTFGCFFFTLVQEQSL